MQKITVEGLSFYECNGGCEYRFAVEYPDYTDHSLPVLCPVFGSEDISFIKDVDFVKGVMKLNE